MGHSHSTPTHLTTTVSHDHLLVPSTLGELQHVETKIVCEAMCSSLSHFFLSISRLFGSIFTCSKKIAYTHRYQIASFGLFSNGITMVLKDLTGKSYHEKILSLRTFQDPHTSFCSSSSTLLCRQNYLSCEFLLC
jgi:hypothetical protein